MRKRSPGDWSRLTGSKLSQPSKREGAEEANAQKSSVLRCAPYKRRAQFKLQGGSVAEAQVTFRELAGKRQKALCQSVGENFHQ